MIHMFAENARNNSLGVALLLGSAVSLQAAAGEYGPLPVTQTAADWLKNCLIYASDTITVPGSFKIFAGTDDPGTYRSDVCAINALTLGGLISAEVPKQARKNPVYYDVALASRAISLEKKSKSQECVYDETLSGGGLNVNRASVVCPNQVDADLTVMPDIETVIPFPTISPGTSPDNDIYLGVNEIHELYLGGSCTPSPDAIGCSVPPFGRITMESKSTLRLKDAGEYHVLSLATSTSSPNGNIVVEEERTSLLVKEFMKMGHRSNVNPDNTGLFKIYVEGGASSGTDWPTTDSFQYRGDGTFYACYVYSPNTTQVWRGKPVKQPGYTTQSFAKGFLQDSGLTVKFVHPQDPECFAPEYGCPCISQNAVPMTCDDGSAPDTGQVRLEARNATDQTVSYLLFIPETTAVPMGATPQQLLDASCLAIPAANLTFDALLANSITATGLNWQDVETECGTGVQLVPVALGPFDPPGTAADPALCWSPYVAKRLVVNTSSCDVVSP